MTTIRAGALASAMSRCSAAIGRGATVPILTSVLLRLGDGKMTIEASNMELAIKQEIAIQGASAWSGCVNAAMLASVAAKLPADAEVAMEFGEQTLTLRCGRTRVTLTVLSAQEFPSFSAGHFECSFEVPCMEMQTALDRVKSYMADNAARAYLCGVHVTQTDTGLRLEATDSNDLGMADIPLSAKGVPDIIIPAPTVTELAKLAAGIGAMKLSISETRIMCEMPGITMISKLIDGAYPQTDRIIPRDNNCVLTVQKNELARALGLTGLIVEGQKAFVRIEGSAASVVLTSGSGADEIVCELMDGSFEWSGPDFTAAFWNKSLAEPTRLCGKKIEFRFRDQRPFLAVDPDDPSARYVAMSIRR